MSDNREGMSPPEIVEGADAVDSMWRMLRYARAMLRTKHRQNTRSAIMAAERYISPEIPPADRLAFVAHLTLLSKLNDAY